MSLERGIALEQLRREADAAAQQALRAVIGHMVNHGARNLFLESKYTTAERLLDLIDEELAAQQGNDPEAPDYFGLFTCEAEARAAFGDR